MASAEDVAEDATAVPSNDAFYFNPHIPLPRDDDFQ